MEEELVSDAIQHEVHLVSDASLTVSQRIDTGTTRSRIPRFLGFFMQPNICLCNKQATFIRCSDKGKGLQDGEWDSLDASLSFLNMPKKHIVGSSNGLLLCSPDFWAGNACYVVCNPVTREFRTLPRPHKVYRYVALTFICKRNSDCASLDKIEYEIARVGIPSLQTYCTTYEVETFSSSAWEWKQSHLVSALPFKLRHTNIPGFVLDDVMYWQDPREILLVHDRSKAEDQENIQLLKFPKGDETVTCHDHVSLSDGKIYYARSTYGCNIELWVLSDYKRAEWILKHKVSYIEINQNNPNHCIIGGAGIGHVHPWNCHLIFLVSDNNVYWYDFESAILHKAASMYSSLYDQFLYEWPCAPNSTGGGCQCLSRL